MNKKLSAIASTLVVLFCIALLIGTGILLWETLPQKKTPQGVTSLDTNSVFESQQQIVEPDREQLFEGAPEIPSSAQDDTDVSSDPSSPAQSGDPAVAQAKAFMQTMSLEEKIWQLFFVRPEDLTGYPLVTLAGDATKKALEEKPVGGLIYFAQNLQDAQQAQALLSNTQSYSKIPLFLGVDEEGGTVSRIGENSALGGTLVDDMASFGEKADPAAVYDAGSTIAAQILNLGFNFDFAPVADVISSKTSSVIATRSFSSDPELCASLVGVMTTSLKDHTVISCLKHFPGYGSVTTDDHVGPSQIDKTLEQLQNCDFLPFIAGIEAGAPFVMVSHSSVPNITGSNTPADLSTQIVTDLLRNQLGFSNVIITDSHQMASITEYASSGEAALKALQAGCDMILMPHDLQQAFDTVLSAVHSGSIPQERIEESVLRILAVKAQYGLLDLAVTEEPSEPTAS